MDLQKFDPAADLREALDIDSMDFLNLFMVVHHRLGVDIPDITLERDVSQDQTWNKQKLTVRTLAASTSAIPRGKLKVLLDHSRHCTTQPSRRYVTSRKGNNAGISPEFRRPTFAITN